MKSFRACLHAFYREGVASVVTQDIPPYVIAAGNPARVAGKLRPVDGGVAFLDAGHQRCARARMQEAAT